MAQLRDAQTSELIAEGTPTEIVLIADTLGQAEVLFDGVGEGFSADAVRTAYEEAVAALRGVAASRAKGTTADEKAAAKAALDALPSPSEKAAAAARKRLKEARARLAG